MSEYISRTDLEKMKVEIYNTLGMDAINAEKIFSKYGFATDYSNWKEWFDTTSKKNWKIRVEKILANAKKMGEPIETEADMAMCIMDSFYDVLDDVSHSRAEFNFSQEALLLHLSQEEIAQFFRE